MTFSGHDDSIISIVLGLLLSPMQIRQFGAKNMYQFPLVGH